MARRYTPRSRPALPQANAWSNFAAFIKENDLAMIAKAKEEIANLGGAGFRPKIIEKYTNEQGESLERVHEAIDLKKDVAVALQVPENKSSSAELAVGGAITITGDADDKKDGHVIGVLEKPDGANEKEDGAATAASRKTDKAKEPKKLTSRVKKVGERAINGGIVIQDHEVTGTGDTSTTCNI